MDKHQKGMNMNQEQRNCNESVHLDRTEWATKQSGIVKLMPATVRALWIKANLLMIHRLLKAALSRNFVRNDDFAVF